LIKKLLIITTLLITLNARENPFFPSAGEEDLLVTSNKDTSLPKLKRATLTLPSDARVIESVIVNYKNLDGSKSSKTLLLGNSIDWHLPLFISQNYQLVNIEDKFREIAKVKYITFLNSKKSLKLVTKDKLIRHFTLVKPHRVVLDFKRDSNLKYYSKSSKTIFKNIRVGNHDGYYRVVIELDGYYKLSVKETNYGYMVKVK
jgi:hypothetical protein